MNGYFVNTNRFALCWKKAKNKKTQPPKPHWTNNVSLPHAVKRAVLLAISDADLLFCLLRNSITQGVHHSQSHRLTDKNCTAKSYFTHRRCTIAVMKHSQKQASRTYINEKIIYKQQLNEKKHLNSRGNNNSLFWHSRSWCRCVH